jgi:sulfate transport system substrate-binding protein
MLPPKIWRKLSGWIFGVVLLALVLFYGLQALVAGSSRPVTVVVYAFSTQEEVLTQGIFPAFERQWEAETGQALTIEAVFGPSGIVARQIVLGAPADVALFSHEQHVTWLRAAHLVDRQTESTPVCYTPMVIVTRPGNPAGVADFSDLAQPGLRLLHPDPHSSGAGQWALLAEYGSTLLETDSQEQAQRRLESIWRNVRLLTPSARTTLTVFELGAGDAFITYEQDARLALERGVPL